jgi:hypothetical protein
MSDIKKKAKDQLVPTHKSVHMIILSCPDCGEEVNQVVLCPDCGKPMRVINVVEKFGEEAEEQILLAKKKLTETKPAPEEELPEAEDEEQPNIILMGGEDVNLDDGGIDPTNDDDTGLDVIFPSDDEGEEAPPKVALDDDELSKALEQLDEEEDTTTDDFEEFGGGEVPEL